MSEDMSEIMSKDMSEIMAKDMSKRMSERYIIRYVRQNVRKYVPNICAFIDGDNKNLRLCQRNLVHGILFFV